MNFHILMDLEPYPQPRPRLTCRGKIPRAYEVPRATAWKSCAALLIQQEMKRIKAKKLTGPLHVYCAFGMKRGKVPIEATRADLDNLAKSLLDAATNAGLWDDDRQIVDLQCVKVFSPGRPSVALHVTEDK